MFSIYGSWVCKRILILQDRIPNFHRDKKLHFFGKIISGFGVYKFKTELTQGPRVRWFEISPISRVDIDLSHGDIGGSNVLTLRCRGRCSDSCDGTVQPGVPWYMIYTMVHHCPWYGGLWLVGGPGTGWHPLNLLDHCLVRDTKSLIDTLKSWTLGQTSEPWTPNPGHQQPRHQLNLVHLLNPHLFDVL